MEKKITIDDKEVTLEQLEEVRKNTQVKLKEVSPGVYVTLQKMQG